MNEVQFYSFRSVSKFSFKLFILFHRATVVEWHVFPAHPLFQNKGMLGKEKG